MADMKAAGINPILAGKYDASTPAGSHAMLQQTDIAGDYATAQQAAKTQQETTNLSIQEHGLLIDNKMKQDVSSVTGNIKTIADEIAIFLQKYKESGQSTEAAEALQNITSDIKNMSENTARSATDLGQTLKNKWTTFWESVGKTAAQVIGAQ